MNKAPLSDKEIEELAKEKLAIIQKEVMLCADEFEENIFRVGVYEGFKAALSNNGFNLSELLGEFYTYVSRGKICDQRDIDDFISYLSSEEEI